MLLWDLLNILQWWATLFFIGIIFLPLTNLIFPNFFDKGYVFAKIIGIAFISYAVFILGFLKILPFETQNVFLIAGIFLLINLFIKKRSNIKIKSLPRTATLRSSERGFDGNTRSEVSNAPTVRSWVRGLLPIFILEEGIFLAILLLWAFIHAHQPEIHGLEKYMDFGFINSILRTEYFPPKDMWLTPFHINYYYFGHLITAVITKASLLPSSITFNLMLATIAAISFTASFSIGANLLFKLNAKRYTLYAGGLLTASILNFAGNLHTIYLFFKPYQNENPVPFWQLVFSPNTFPNSYWYPNATRFIENTIHEFPLYSYVVSDLHGHVLDIPFVLLTIAVLLSLLLSLKIENLKLKIPLIGFLLAVMYMTNAWDGLIYFVLSFFIICYFFLRSNINFQGIQNYILKFKTIIPSLAINILILGAGFIIFTLPFNLNFKPFTSGIGVLCGPEFLTNMGKLGPFLFEKDHCQHSPLWQLFILYGFFYFFIFSFILFLKLNVKRYALNASDIFVGILIILSTLLIIIPELIYVKDIYPAHYRANTMFKLAYQSFIMLSLSCGYIIIRILNIKNQISKMQTKNKIFNFYYVYLIFAILFFILVFLYPYFSIKSYFGDLRIYSGLNGITYLNASYPNDYEAILWINKNIKGQPVILEAQGDSYTDYGRVSANTGLPTVLGWTVHEWLWRGTYDIPSPRIEEVKNLYESTDLSKTKELIKKYSIKLVFIGGLEKEKYPNLNEEKFKILGKNVYQNGNTNIYKIGDF